MHNWRTFQVGLNRVGWFYGVSMNHQYDVGKMQFYSVYTIELDTSRKGKRSYSSSEKSSAAHHRLALPFSVFMMHRALTRRGYVRTFRLHDSFNTTTSTYVVSKERKATLRLSNLHLPLSNPHPPPASPPPHHNVRTFLL